jgi:uncharacterized protein (TIGR03382 family)
MTRAALISALVGLLPGGLAHAQLVPMTRDQAIAIAKPAMKYSYWWGGGCWRADGTCPGICRGNCTGCGCPQCTHSASAGCDARTEQFGADCSGLVNKTWKLPSVPACGHGPYNTGSYFNDRTYWSEVPRASAQRGDAFVYRSGGSGHIFLFESFTPGGSAYAYECKGCSFGCTYNIRPTTGYVVRRRNAMAADKDTDGDGVPDSADNCPSIANPAQQDTNKDGKGDACDGDDDGDGIADGSDNCPLAKNVDQADADRDGIGDACDLDDDNDGIPDIKDSCRLVKNPAQLDTDKDGQGDECDADDDNDGVADLKDNCPKIKNADQKDGNRDGIGDACQADSDRDGFPDSGDNCPSDANADQADADRDGKGDACDPDDDDDAVVDGKDNCPKTPNAGQEDADRDGTGDACDSDRDGDGLSNETDNCPDAKNRDQLDQDGDSKGDLCDPDLDGDSVPNSADNCPKDPNPRQEDQDGNGVGDACQEGDGDDTPDAGVANPGGDAAAPDPTVKSDGGAVTPSDPGPNPAEAKESLPPGGGCGCAGEPGAVVLEMWVLLGALGHRRKRIRSAAG